MWNQIDLTHDERGDRLQQLAIAVEEDQRPAIFSSENMCIGPWQDDPRYHTTDSPERITARISEYFPDATIILCLRPQVEWIESWWRQKVNGFLTDTPGTMLKTPFWRDTLLPRLRYDETLQHYRDTFGESRVKVLFMSDLRRDPSAFVARLCEMIGIEVPVWQAASRNEGRSNAYLYTKLRANRAYLASTRAIFSERFCKKQLDHHYHQFWKRYLAHSDHILMPFSGRKALRGEKAQEIHDMFRHSNRALAGMLNIDLAEHGFDI